MEGPSDLTKEQLIKLLEETCASDPNVKNTAYESIRRSNRKNVISVLDQLLDERDTNLSCQAAKILVDLDPLVGVRLVLPHLNSPDSTLRWVICGLLSNHGNKEAVLPLVNVLKNDSEADVRMLAAFALGKIGDRRAIPTLQWAQQHDYGIDYEGRRVSDVAKDAIREILEQNPQ
jgi:HEAT repeat protein